MTDPHQHQPPHDGPYEPPYFPGPHDTPAPGNEFGHPTHHAPPAVRQTRRPKRGRGVALAIALTAIVLIGAGGATIAFVFRDRLFKDSGVAMCEQLRDAKKASPTPDTGASPSPKNLSVDDYHRLRKPFADSRYDDLREAGTKFIDLFWQLEQAAGSKGGDAGLGMAFAMIGQLTGAYSSLAGACANHGVDIPPLGSS